MSKQSKPAAMSQKVSESFAAAKSKVAAIPNLTGAGVAVSSLWEIILETIQTMLAAGGTVAAIEAAVDAMISATTLPPFLQGLLISVANSIIAALAAQKPVPTPAN